MSVRENVLKLAQLKYRVTDADFASHLDTCLEETWGMVAAMYPWDFLMCADPYVITVTAGSPLYTVNKDDVGRMLFIGNSNGVPTWTFRDRRHYNRMVKGGETEDNSGEVTGTIQIFTTEGMKNGKWQIRVYPNPSAGGTYYLYYTRRGTLANLELAPAGFGKLLLHGMGSMVSPPAEYRTPDGQMRWKALTKDEDGQFEMWLDKLRGHMVTPEDGPVYIEPVLANEIEDANLSTGI